MGRPAKYYKPLTASYRVSEIHRRQVDDLRRAWRLPSNSDVIEEAVRRAHAEHVDHGARERVEYRPAARTQGAQPSQVHRTVMQRYLPYGEAAEYLGLTDAALRARVKKRTLP